MMASISSNKSFSGLDVMVGLTSFLCRLLNLIRGGSVAQAVGFWR